ncbi:hypothetical protein OU415_12000 [Saccharopolyspora sp. WRP15-2]|uniref:Uncharacterized protein n=1 Tax=Saccharopolyspora oryzae TaxID=2997343 RepID=A0ABT4UY82_9PSEU|nr:hypothetical protein [Saccharopolyspora oryzae]MDA3626161.1 hypothetical protein [Saccharopolyspora oryzae]
MLVLPDHAATLIDDGLPSFGGVVATTRPTPATSTIKTVKCADAVSG